MDWDAAARRDKAPGSDFSSYYELREIDREARARQEEADRKRAEQRAARRAKRARRRANRQSRQNESGGPI